MRIQLKRGKCEAWFPDGPHTSRLTHAAFCAGLLAASSFAMAAGGSFN
jgi:hypothetical protein